MTNIEFSIGDVPKPAAPQVDHTTNPYYKPAEAIKDLKGQAAIFKLPHEKDDTYARATGRCRSLLNKLGDHYKRTIRATFSPAEDQVPVSALDKEGKAISHDLRDVTVTMWMMDRKIVRTKKEKEGETPANTAEGTATAEEAPAETAADAPSESPAVETTTEATAEPQPEETPATTSQRGRNKGGRNSRG